MGQSKNRYELIINSCIKKTIRFWTMIGAEKLKCFDEHFSVVRNPIDRFISGSSILVFDHGENVDQDFFFDYAFAIFFAIFIDSTKLEMSIFPVPTKSIPVP